MSEENLISTFFYEYARAFSRFDVSSIAKCWNFPAFMITAGRSVAFNTADTFESNSIALCEFYQRQGMTRAEKSIAHISELYSEVFLVKTHDELFNREDQKLIEWVHTYIVRVQDDRVSILASIPDGEGAAWNQRGTPIGTS